MKVYSITYDLKQPGRDYSNLYDELKKSYKWWHFLESTWLVCTNETPDQIWGRIHPHIDNNDFVLVVEIRNYCQGWLPKDAWGWINENVPPSN